MTKTTDLQFLFGKYEEATQEISRLSKELEDVKMRNAENILRIDKFIERIYDLEYDIKDTRLAINMIIAECSPTSKVTKQDLLNALETISGIVNEGVTSHD